jgi:thiamine pyrophosphokinase
MEKRCVIAGAGEHFYPPDIHSGDLVIAADGGFSYLEKTGVRPDAVIGDFDSLTDPPAGINIVRLPAVKDDTDTAAAIKYGFCRGYKSFHIYGGTGGRLDHTLANAQCLAYIADRGGRGFLYGDGFILTCMKKGGKMAFPIGQSGAVSVFAHTNTATVSLSGFLYPLDNAVLSNSFPLGVSNEFTGGEAKITVADGSVLVYFPYDSRNNIEGF